MPDMSSSGHRLSFAKETVLFSEGERATDWYEIADGVVRTCRYLANGNRHVTGFFAKGEVFGVETLRYRATAEAVTEVTLIRRARRSLETFAAERTCAPSHPISLALQSAEERIQLLVLKGAPARLAGFLLGAAVKDGAGGLSVHLPMRQADIADYLAIDVATVNRILSRFVRSRLLSPRQDQRYHIGDPGRLEAIAGGEPWPGGASLARRSPEPAAQMVVQGERHDPA